MKINNFEDPVYLKPAEAACHKMNTNYSYAFQAGHLVFSVWLWAVTNTQ